MFARHDLVWLTESGWRQAHATAPPGCADALEGWRRSGWPAVVRRADPGHLAAGQVAVGIALPPRPKDGCKKRIACRVAADAVARTAPPVRLGDVLGAAPDSWRDTLATLEQSAAANGLAVRVYGSAALQALTQQAYLTPASDIDVLLHPATRRQLYLALDLLRSHAARVPLDGEIVFPDSRAVSWKELARAIEAPAGARVLVKSIHGVTLATSGALLATMRENA